jgi:hypothetical protein
MARAQEPTYQTDTPDPEARKNQGIALQCIRDPASFPANQAKFEDYFTKFYFPSMTGDQPDQLARLGVLRYGLFRDYLWKTDNEQLQKTLSDAAYNAMAKVLNPRQNPPYHPAVRYNAILIMGMLDDQYAREGTSPRPPKPYARATTALTNVVATATKDMFPPPVILGAVIGLERHAKYRDALPPAAVQAMTAALQQLVAHKEPLQDMDRTAYAWLRLRAANVLAQLGSVGPNNSVHDALVGLIGDLRSLDDRCAAAALLAKIKYEGANVDGAASAEALFALARDVAADAKKQAEKSHEEISRGGGYVPDAGAIYSADGSTQQEKFPRRQILSRLVDLRTGLRAVKPEQGQSIVPQDAQPKVDAVIAAINPVIQSALDKDTVELKLTQDIVTMADAIDRAIPAAQPPAAAEEEPDF